MRFLFITVLATFYLLFEPASAGLKDYIPNLTPFLYPKETCYDVVGCFSNRPPWNVALRVPFPPKPPKEVSTYMYFHNRDTKEANGTKFQISPEIDFSNVKYSEKKPTFVISHGWHESGDLPRYVALAKALLKRTDANVFVVDYSPSAYGNSYFQSLGDIRLVGRLVAIVLLKAKIPPSLIHLIGHSLGSQVVAYAAKYLAKNGGKPARITGLDPAFPQFQLYSKKVRLTKKDGEYVDIVHTAAGQRGYPFPGGHIDFYVNGGIRQPTCEKKDFTGSFSRCSHQLSVILYTKSVEEDGCIVGEKKPLLKIIAPALRFPGVPVNSSLHCDKNECVSMGMGLHKGQEGTFDVPTSKPPYICNNKF